MSVKHSGDTRQAVIEHGQHILEEAGTQAICRVCIKNGGSCCTGCPFLIDGVGCQNRNTSCTSWLCGFLEYIFHEVSLLPKWNDFWQQVPGMDFRRDETPAQFEVSTWLEAQDLRPLAEAFANDLQNHLANHEVDINDFNYLLQLHVRMRTTPQSVYNRAYVEAKTRQMQRIFSTFHRLLKAGS